MRSFVNVLGVLMTFLSISLACHADPVTDKKSITTLIHQFYREPEQAISAGEFKGKFDPKRQCVLLKQYVHDSLIKTGRLPAEKTHCGIFGRFPGYTLQDDMGGWDAPPKYKLVSVAVSGDLAEAVVEMPPEYYPTTEKKYYVARVESYLKRFPQGWRIYAARIYDRYVHPEDLRFMPSGHGPEYFYRVVDEEGQPPGIALPADRASK